jgi:hypothetical protein
LMAGLTLAGCGSDEDSSPERADLINQLVDDVGSDSDVRDCARKGLESLSTEDLQTLAAALQSPAVNQGEPVDAELSPELAAERDAIQRQCVGTSAPDDAEPAG